MEEHEYSVGKFVKCVEEHWLEGEQGPTFGRTYKITESEETELFKSSSKDKHDYFVSLKDIKTGDETTMWAVPAPQFEPVTHLQEVKS